MTDEPREDLKPEEEDVEGHAAPLAPLSPGEKFANDDDDVEGHAPPPLAPL